MILKMKNCGCDDHINSEERSYITNKNQHDTAFTSDPEGPTAYHVDGNLLIVQKGGVKQRIPIYTCEPSFQLTRQFKMLNLYLNQPVNGVFTPNLPRETPPGSNTVTNYKSSGMIKG